MAVRRPASAGRAAAAKASVSNWDQIGITGLVSADLRGRNMGLTRLSVADIMCPRGDLNTDAPHLRQYRPVQAKRV